MSVCLDIFYQKKFLLQEELNVILPYEIIRINVYRQNSCLILTTLKYFGSL